MLTDPPLCWLYRATGSDRTALPTWAAERLAAFVFPAAGPGSAGMLRGRVFEIVVFRDRPEVRRLLDFLLSDRLAVAATATLVPVGLWPVAAGDPALGPDAVVAAERDLLARALAGQILPAASATRPLPALRRCASPRELPLPARPLGPTWTPSA